LPADFPRESIAWIDHHGALAGQGKPTSLEQVFRLLDFPEEHWTRDLALVAANDRGHIRGLQDVGATADEICSIRARDRQAQGITDAEERAGRDAAARAEVHFGGRVTVVRLPHDRTATVTDSLDAALGGPGAENLVVMCPRQTVFFGSGRCIGALRERYPQGWWGGELPERGYWGIGEAVDGTDILQCLHEGLK